MSRSWAGWIPPGRMKKLLRVGGVGLLLVGLAVYVCHRGDRVVLREIAEGIVRGIEAPSEKVRAVNRWVHWRGGFSGNKGSYLFQRFGATPLQVVDDGGDCADKSRLVVALLREVGIGATAAMCFDRHTGEPVHTVVEARLGGDRYMVVDPSFDLDFPKERPGEYYGLLDLRRDPTILPSRLDAITSSRDYWMRVNGYRREQCVYDLASTLNWNKNALTRAGRAVLAPLFGESLYRLPRPTVLEEPKLGVAVAALLVGLAATAASVFVPGLLARRFSPAPAGSGAAGRAGPMVSMSGGDGPSRCSTAVEFP